MPKLNKITHKFKPSKWRADWPLTFSIFHSLTEGGTGGRVKEKVKPQSERHFTFVLH